jgi:hypothetical protein
MSPVTATPVKNSGTQMDTPVKKYGTYSSYCYSSEKSGTCETWYREATPVKNLVRRVTATPVKKSGTQIATPVKKLVHKVTDCGTSQHDLAQGQQMPCLQGWLVTQLFKLVGQPVWLEVFPSLGLDG